MVLEKHANVAIPDRWLGYSYHNLLKEINKEQKLVEILRPCDVFDLAGGPWISTFFIWVEITPSCNVCPFANLVGLIIQCQLEDGD